MTVHINQAEGWVDRSDNIDIDMTVSENCRLNKIHANYY